MKKKYESLHGTNLWQIAFFKDFVLRLIFGTAEPISTGILLADS